MVAVVGQGGGKKRQAHRFDSMLGAEQLHKDMLKFYQSFYSKIDDENSKYEKKCIYKIIF